MRNDTEHHPVASTHRQTCGQALTYIHTDKYIQHMSFTHKQKIRNLFFNGQTDRFHIYITPDFWVAKNSRYIEDTGLGIRRVLYCSLANLLCDPDSVKLCALNNWKKILLLLLSDA